MKNIFSFLLFYLCATQIWAHPHAFIELKTAPLVKDDLLIGFSTQWTLDEASSSELLYDIQLHGNKGVANQELVEEMFQNVVSEHYFSYFYDKQGNKIKYRSKPQNYGLKAIGTQIQYYFDFILTNPVPLKNTELTLMTYDRTYYVAMAYQNKNSLNFTALPPQCRGELVEPNVDSKIQEYAASLDQTQRDEDDSLGQLFAQKIKILCQ